MPRYIPIQALENLRKYKYAGVDKSIVSRYVLNPYWNWLVTLWPTSVAPNTITLTGLCLVIMNVATLLYYDPHYLTEKGGAQTPPPSWVYFSWAAGLFMYQSLDAIDGKQARRTGMAGPLGEMFDHGCDAINTTLGVILGCYAINLGRSWWTVASCIATSANFYLTTWEEYHTGSLYLGVFSGPVEGILLVVVNFALTGLFGPSFWDQGLLTVTGLDHVAALRKIVPNTPLNVSFMWFGAAGLLFNIATSYSNVLRASSKSESSLRPLIRLMPFPITVALQLLWLSAPTPDRSAIIYSDLFLPFLVAWGASFAHTVGRMILAHITKSEFPLWDWMWLWSILGAFDAAMPTLFNRPPLIQSTPERTAAFVYAMLAVTVVTYGRFVVLVIDDITNYLGIACLTVRKRDVNGEWRAAGEVEKQKETEKKA